MPQHCVTFVWGHCPTKVFHHLFQNWLRVFFLKVDNMWGRVLLVWGASIQGGDELKIDEVVYRHMVRALLTFIVVLLAARQLEGAQQAQRAP